MALLLGIDMGTTKSACVIVDSDRRTLLACESMAHQAAAGGGIQDARRHVEVVRRLIGRLPESLRGEVKCVGVAGQMHGVVLWSRHAVSPLFTWQSVTRDLEHFQTVAPDLRHGFGVATLAQLASERKLDAYEYAGTIHDYLVWQLTGCPGKPVMDYSDAASWGTYRLRENCFDGASWARLGIPERLMPQVVPVCSNAGVVAGAWGIPRGIPVMAAVGDNQASVAATAEDPSDEIYLTLGTGAQLSIVADRLAEQVECRPYLDGKYLAVGTPLCGGAAWAWLQQHVKAWLNALGCAPIPDAELYDRIDALAAAALQDDDLPAVHPHFLGERSDPGKRGVIEHLTLTNFTPGKFAAALAIGIVENLQGMLPRELWQDRKRLLVSGNAIRKTRALQAACVRCFGIEPIPVSGREEAACGAALLSGRLLKETSDGRETEITEKN